MSAASWVGVALLGGLGAVMRLLVSGWLHRGRTIADWPLGTFAVNLSGAFLLGLLSGTGTDWHVPAVIGLGLLGGYTTFSTWMIESAAIADAGKPRRAGLYITASLTLGLLAALLGRAISGAL